MKSEFRFSVPAALVYFCFYMLLAWKLSWPEAIAAMASACAVASIAGGHRIGSRFKIRPAWLFLLFRRTILRVFTDTALVFALLGQCLLHGRRPEGRILKIPFDPGSNNSYSRSRRALVAAFVSFPPNTIAVFLDEKERLLVLHQLYPTPAPPGRGDRKWPL